MFTGRAHDGRIVVGRPNIGTIGSARSVDVFASDDIMPPQPTNGSAVLHDREYRVRAYRLADDRLLIQGAIRDQKPPGLYLEDDPDPLTVHHMQLSMEIAFPELEITAATVHFETHPNTTCPSIVDHYGNLVGLSIARGFTHRVRELFGGPRGCTHTTALLQAMAPVAMQCFWSMKAAAARDEGRPSPIASGEVDDDEGWKRIIGTCHVWDPDGDAVAARRDGTFPAVPVFLQRRLDELGREAPARWQPD
ncbi:MAG: DUF2889 domain-containing protein [Ilumatobacteraceae bacterium]